MANTEKTGNSILEKGRQLAEEILPGGCRVELIGNRQAVIEGSTGILAYSDEAICIHAGRYTVQLLGRDLQIRALSSTYVVVEGFLRTVSYP